MHIRFLQCGPGLLANRCDVIARKPVVLYDHLATLLPEFSAGSISTRRLPDSSEPWASDLCQATPFDLLFENCVQQFHLYFGDKRPSDRVSRENSYAAGDGWFAFA
jgi:hypothetical protein